VGAGPSAIAIPATGNKAYVTNPGDDTVSIIDTTADTSNPLDDIALDPGSSPSAAAATPDSARVYVANEDANDISIIDTATDMRIGTNADDIDVGMAPRGIVLFAPPGAPAPPPPAPPEGAPPPPPPLLGEKANVDPIRGKVKTKCKGNKSFGLLPIAEQIPIGCQVDTRDDRVELTSARKRRRPCSGVDASGSSRAESARTPAARRRRSRLQPCSHWSGIRARQRLSADLPRRLAIRGGSVPVPITKSYERLQVVDVARATRCLLHCDQMFERANPHRRLPELDTPSVVIQLSERRHLSDALKHIDSAKLGRCQGPVSGPQEGAHRVSGQQLSGDLNSRLEGIEHGGQTLEIRRRRVRNDVDVLSPAHVSPCVNGQAADKYEGNLAGDEAIDQLAKPKRWLAH